MFASSNSRTNLLNNALDERLGYRVKFITSVILFLLFNLTKMSSNTQAAATTPSVANGNNVNYIASFAKSGNDPNSFDDGIHGSYHNAYVKTTSNVGGGFNEPYRLSKIDN